MPAAAAHALDYSAALRLLPAGVAPAGAVQAHGARVWDEDGKEYVDFCNGFGTVLVGYGDPAVAAAVDAADSVPHARLEADAAERLCALVPCAEGVRFGIRTSQALTEAVHIACAHTGRRRVLTAGPAAPGWPRAIAERRVPSASDLASVFPLDDLAALEALLDAHYGEAAAIVLEPANAEAASFGYLHAVRRLADRHRALLIFDETVTGFRFHEGGAQALFGVTPDLAVFGPGLANGMALSALAGRRELIEQVEDGKLAAPKTALAAAGAVLRMLDLLPVVTSLRVRGAEVQAETEALLASSGASAFLSIGGDPTWSRFRYSPQPGVDADALRRLFLRETAARGLVMFGEHAMSYAHGDEEISHLVEVYAEVFPLLVEAAGRGPAR